MDRNLPNVVDPGLKPVYVTIYAALREAWLLYGESPSKDELARAAMCSSTSIHNALRELRRKGYVSNPKHSIRNIRPTDLERTITREPPDPWAEIDGDEPKYWKPPGT